MFDYVMQKIPLKLRLVGLFLVFGMAFIVVLLLESVELEVTTRRLDTIVNNEYLFERKILTASIWLAQSRSDFLLYSSGELTNSVQLDQEIQEAVDLVLEARNLVESEEILSLLDEIDTLLGKYQSLVKDLGVAITAGNNLEVTTLKDKGIELVGTIEQTLDRGWEVLSQLPAEELHRVTETEIEKFYGK